MILGIGAKDCCQEFGGKFLKNFFKELHQEPSTLRVYRRQYYNCY